MLSIVLWVCNLDFGPQKTVSVGRYLFLGDFVVIGTSNMNSKTEVLTAVLSNLINATFWS